MDSYFQTLDDLPLMAKADIAKRLRSHVRPHCTARRPELMLPDIAKWVGCSNVLLKQVASGLQGCSNRLQVRMTQFYSLLDSGKVEFVMNGKGRAIMRADPRRPPIIPPLKKKLLHIDFTERTPKMALR